MNDKQVIDNLTAANLRLHIEANELQDAVLDYLDKMKDLRTKNTFLELKITSLERKINAKVLK